MKESTMDLDAVFSLIDRAEKSSFNKIEIEYKELKLRLERGAGQMAAAAPQPVQPQQPAAPETENRPEQTEPDSGDYIRSPISGVFYVAKEPGAEPFVREGSRVCKGDTVCIIEAMKTMNEITAPFSGVITAVLKKDKDPVTAGDALFRLVGDK
jgi:acetyl-CoA carboxylase biotin carboxyl carrier protein